MKIALMILLVSSVCAAGAAPKPLPKECSEIQYPCSWDRSMQPALIRVSPSAEARPLVVALHTWSFDHRGSALYVPLCVNYDFHMIGPAFRGPNSRKNPLSTGSDAAVADIVSAVEYMKKNHKVDENRIYLIGGSGGGHMALLMAGRHPEIWAGVSAWCPISDLVAWYTFHQGKGYGAHIAQNCGGNPETLPAARAEALKRSPLTWLNRARQVPVDIATGIHDGHTGSVPVSHTLNAFNVLALESDRVPADDIAFIVRNCKIPEGFPEPSPDRAYGKRKIHLRKSSGNARVTIFEGGHHILPSTGLAWLVRQRKGTPAVWGSAAGDGKTVELTR